MRLLILCWSLLLVPQISAGPTNALVSYFKALKTHDKNLLRSAIHAPAEYQDQFVRVIDVARRLQMIDGLLVKKYGTPPDERHDISKYLGTLSTKVSGLTTETKGDRARSVPSNPGEASVPFIRIDNEWKLDFDRGQAKQDLARLSKTLKLTYDAIIPLLNGLIQKIDTLDTNKFTYEEAWKIVSVQMQRKIEAAIQGAK